MRRLLSIALCLVGLVGTAFAVTPLDPPVLAAGVAAGTLPPAARRVPEEPLVGGFETLGLYHRQERRHAPHPAPEGQGHPPAQRVGLCPPRRL